MHGNMSVSLSVVVSQGYVCFYSPVLWNILAFVGFKGTVKIYMHKTDVLHYDKLQSYVFVFHVIFVAHCDGMEASCSCFYCFVCVVLLHHCAFVDFAYKNVQL